MRNSVADPGFHRQGGGRQPLSFGQKPIIWQDFFQKLHVMNEIGPRGVPGTPLDPPMQFMACKNKLFQVFLTIFICNIKTTKFSYIQRMISIFNFTFLNRA